MGAPQHIIDTTAKTDGPDFNKLFLEARPRLLAVARRIVRNEDDAEDVVQTAFENGLKFAHQFEGKAQATTWMHRIVTNAALMHLRSRRRKGADSLDALPPELADAAVARQREDSMPAVDPEQALRNRRLRGRLFSAITALPEVDQKIIALRLGEGYSVAEVGAEVGMTSAATKTRLHRARKKLTGVLEAAQLAAA